MHISDGILAPSVCVAGYVGAAGLVALGLRKSKDADVARTGILTASFFLASLVRVPVPGASVHLMLASLNGIALGPLCFPSIFIALLLQALLLGHGGVSSLGVNMVMMSVPAYLMGMVFHKSVKIKSGGGPFFAAGMIAVFALAPKFTVDILSAAGLSDFQLSWPLTLVSGALLGVALYFVIDKVVAPKPVFKQGFAAGALSVIFSALVFFLVLRFAPLAGHITRTGFTELARIAFIMHLPVAVAEGIITAFLIKYLDTVVPGLLRAGGGSSES